MSEFINDLISNDKISLVLKKQKKFSIGNRKVGEDLFVIAGPCSVESNSMIVNIAKKLKKIGVSALRGGAYKPATFPVNKSINGWKEGLKKIGLEYLDEARKITGLPIVTEIMDPRQLEASLDYLDVIQIGTRNFQNYTLLDEVGKTNKPVLLKRGTWATLDEILGASERVLKGGNSKLMICLRGVIGAPTYRHIFKNTRWTPDLLMIPALKKFINIPIIYDPSHSVGHREFVHPISLAAIAAGADGLMIEVHENPAKSISDPDQAVNLKDFKKIFNDYQKFVYNK